MIVEKSRQDPKSALVFFWTGCVLTLLFVATASAQQPQELPGTKPLTWEERGGDLADRLMDGAHRFVEQQIAASAKKRPRFWDRDSSSAEAYARSVAANRQHLAEIIGAVDERRAPEMQRFGHGTQPGLVAQTKTYRIWQVRWPVLEHVWGEGLLVEPEGEATGSVVVVPDLDQTPEGVMGLDESVTAPAQVARRLAERGLRAVILTTVDRQHLPGYDSPLRQTGQIEREWISNRHWIYRQAFHLGRHIIGYEVQKVRAAVDWFTQRDGAAGQVGVVGYGEGGLISFYAAAIDQRIDATLVSGYFEERQDLWREPIYRQVWDLLEQFGDAEIASLIAPRRLVVEYAPIPKAGRDEGRLATPPFGEVQAEFQRVGELVPARFTSAELVAGAGGSTTGPMSHEAIERFAEAFTAEERFVQRGVERALEDRRPRFDEAARQRRQLDGLEEHVQQLVRQSEHVRDRFYLFEVMPDLNVPQAEWSTRRRHETFPVEPFVERSKKYRKLYAEELIGRFDVPLLPPKPRTRKIIENEAWTAYDVVLDVHEDLFAWGVLLVPADLEPGEQRPVVVCQHGRNGLPRDLIDADKTSYNNFAARLAERGFIAFVPHNLYRTEARYRWLDRKASTIGTTLFSFILDQHEQILNWLDGLPFVDGNRIGFYGLSFGGETALRVPPILQKYALSISSGYFNEEARKVSSTLHPFSYMYTSEWEVPYWNLGNTFGHAEAAYLMVPRPFMVERGMWDTVGRDRWVAHEYAKVRFLYTQLGLGNRVEAEFFRGGHSAESEESFRFLHKWLDWPAEKEGQ